MLALVLLVIIGLIWWHINIDLELPIVFHKYNLPSIRLILCAWVATIHAGTIAHLSENRLPYNRMCCKLFAGAKEWGNKSYSECHFLLAWFLLHRD
jgi:hypothetical protein